MRIWHLQSAPCEVQVNVLVHQQVRLSRDNSKCTCPDLLLLVTGEGRPPAPAFRSGYVSSFRPNIVESPQPEWLLWDDYTFRRVTIEIDSYGNIKQNLSSEDETIEISAEWRRNIGDTPKEGYVAKGFMKHAFKVNLSSIYPISTTSYVHPQGRFDDQDYTIFESKPCSHSAAENTNDLIAELRLLALGDYFARSFKERAKYCDVPINGL